MFKNNIFTISIVAVILITILSWFVYNNHGKTDAHIWDMIPNDAALIIEIDDPNSFIENINSSNLIWESLLKVPSIETLNNNIKWLDTLLVNNTTYEKLLWNKPITIAFFSDTVSTVETLIFSKLGIKLDVNELKAILTQELGRDFAILSTAQITDGFKIIDANNSTTSYFMFVDGVLVYSSSLELLAKLKQTYRGKLNKLTDDPFFNTLKHTGGKKVQARTFIQYSKISNLIMPLAATKQLEFVNWIGKFAKWTEVDLLLKKNEVIFSGFSISDGVGDYLNTLAGQKPVSFKALNVIPYNANILLWIGTSNFGEYFKNCNSEPEINGISARLNIDINKLVNVIGNEIVFASSADTPGSFRHNSWMFAKTKNKKSAAAVLKQISINTGNTKHINHKDYQIGQIVDADFIADFFGDAFSIIQDNYYTFIGDYVVFANSQSSLLNIINYFETGKTLDLNDNFKAFSDNISSQSNLLLYFKPGSLDGVFPEFISEDVYKHFMLNNDVVKSFQGIAVQISMEKKLWYTNFYIKHGVSYREENLALWKLSLDDEIVWGPYLVKDHQTKTENIIVFDKLNNMYLINSDGNILWKRKLDAKPMSDIFEVDYYKNGKIQYLFNTNSNIYFIDKKGRNVKGFPKKLHSKATNGVVVFDYLKNKDYRLVVAQSDKRIYNYTIKGKEVKGWKPPRTQNIVVEPVTRLLANKKDYLIITDIGNEIKIVDRKGRRRIKLTTNPNKAKNSEYYVNRTNSKGIIITTNKKGKLVYISASGKLKFTDFGNFSPNHFFLYEDFNGDNSKDFIFVDGKYLKVFDRFKKLLFSYKFGSIISIKPSFFTFGRKQHIMGVVANEERTIYLFDKKGNIIISKGLVGETPFIVGDLELNNRINLISAAGNTLYNYRLE